MLFFSFILSFLVRIRQSRIAGAVITCITIIIIIVTGVKSSTYFILPGRVAQSVGHLTRRSGVLGLIPGLATYFRFSFRFFKKGSCQLLAKVCARSTG